MAGEGVRTYLCASTPSAGTSSYQLFLPYLVTLSNQLDVAEVWTECCFSPTHRWGAGKCWEVGLTSPVVRVGRYVCICFVSNTIQLALLY